MPSNRLSFSTPPRSPGSLSKCLFSQHSPFSPTLNVVRRCKKGQVQQLSGFKVSLPTQHPDLPLPAQGCSTFENDDVVTPSPFVFAGL